MAVEADEEEVDVNLYSLKIKHVGSIFSLRSS